MENKRLLIVAVLLIFSIIVIFAYDKIMLKRQNKKEETNQQPLLSTVSLQHWNDSILAIEAETEKKVDPSIVRDLFVFCANIMPERIGEHQIVGAKPL